LFQLVYEAGFRLGARRCLIGTTSNLCRIFERFGFRQRASYADPVVGSLIAMDLDLHDYHHMADIKSPLLNVYRYLVEEQMKNKSQEIDILNKIIYSAQVHETTRSQYVRYLSMQYHLTKGVQRYFLTIAAHHDFARRRQFRDFLIKFANEEELHYLVAANDLYKLGEMPIMMPFDVELWHAYFEKVTASRPFLRLGTACVLETISAGKARAWVKKALEGKFLTAENTKFLVLHQHETLPHGDQLIDAIKSGSLEDRHFADLIEGAKKGTVLYLRLAEWALNPSCLSGLADDFKISLSEDEEGRIRTFAMSEL
jgi:hypothetical protein